MTGRKSKSAPRIRKSIEKWYIRETAQDGSVTFCKGEPFKYITIYDADGKPFKTTEYYGDGTFCNSWREENEKVDWYYAGCHIAESRFDDDGLIVYKRYEPDPDIKERHWFLSQELFYEYRNGVLFRGEIITHLAASAKNEIGTPLIDSGYTEPLIRKDEAFYDDRGGIIRWLRYDINSSEITNETTYRYEYDRHGNLIYIEQCDSSGPYVKTYYTIKYWEDDR